MDVKQLNALGASGSWLEAGKLVDDAIAHSSRPDLLWNISAYIAMRSIRSPEHIDSGIQRLCVLIDAWSSQPDLHAVATRDISAGQRKRLAPGFGYAHMWVESGRSIWRYVVRRSFMWSSDTIEKCIESLQVIVGNPIIVIRICNDNHCLWFVSGTK